MNKTLLFLIILLAFQTASAEWIKQNVDTLAWLRTVHFSDANVGWVGGSKGTVLKTEDGGNTWTRQPKFTKDTIRQVYFLDKRNGWLLCERDIYSLGNRGASYLLKTSNGGISWDRVDLRNAQRQRITRLFFANNGFGLAIGEMGVLFGLMDDNRTWKKLSLPTSYLMSDGVFLNELFGVVVGGGGSILLTDDAGTTWNRAMVSGASKSKLNALFFNDRRNGWAVGSNGRILHTVNGGRFWRPQNSKTNQKLSDVFFVNSAEGWAVGDDGILLHTTTAGNVWRKVGSGSSHSLESIYFNGTRGWAVGFGGTLLSYEKSATKRTRRPRFRARK